MTLFLSQWLSNKLFSGLQSLKRLLDDSISGDFDRKEKLAILQAYLEAVKPRGTSEETVHLNDVMEMWSFAAQANDEGVLSSVAVVLALLLQVVSDSLELVPYGLGICQTLLQERQLKSLSRNLSSEKGKGFIISPTLRLLREVVSFDGGAFAKRVVRARAYTFTSLGRNLEIGHAAENPEDFKKASVRTNSVRFFLSCLKYLHSEGRKEILSQKDLLSHLTYMVKNDPPQLVLEIMESLKRHVLMDSKIAREAKFRVFNIKTLMRFLSLYTYSHAAASADEKELVCSRAHQLVLYICTTPGAGVLYPYQGLYPKESDDEFSALSTKNSGSGHSGDPWEGKLRDGVPVYNFVLSEFVGKLRPWANLKHCELLVAIFGAAPELIADYFYNNRSFTFEPKLSMTWIGYAAFLFNTMMVPFPPAFGDPARYAQMPPPVSILLDNIIPSPINQKVLVRCMSTKSNLTSFFATRILVASLEKLSVCIKMLDGHAKRKSSLWAEAKRRLVDMFCQRIPDMKEVVRCYKTIPSENILHRALASRLLRLYYEVIPRVALAANFDVSSFFVEVLKGLHEEHGDAEKKELGILELENLVSIASYSPGMRWFARLDSLGSAGASSPFGALLQLLCNGEQGTPLNQLRQVLADVAVESQVVTDPTDLKPLLQALRCATETMDSESISCTWNFLDNCISRCATSPIKYLDLMNAYASEKLPSAQESGGSLLGVAIVEQLPFAAGADKVQEAARLAPFVSLYFNAAQSLSNQVPLIETLYNVIEQHFKSISVTIPGLGNAKQMKALKKCKVEWLSSKATKEETLVFNEKSISPSHLEDMLHVPFEAADETSVLSKWASKSVEDLVEDGWAVALVRLLGSEHINLRKEAHTAILKMAAQIKESSYEENTQIWLLLSELAESSRSQVDIGPVPSAFTAFTIHALEILKNPLHPLYPKINGFLTRSPVWPMEKLPLAHDILHGEPSEDDKYYTELTWLLNYLLDSLKTPFDLGVFHKKRWLEKIFALGSNPYLRSALRTRLLKLVYRATCVETGSTTMITRFGVLSWLDSQRVACEVNDDAAVYEALLRRAWDTCDQDRVRAWSKGGVQQMLDRLSA